MEQWKIQRERTRQEVCSRGGCALAGEPEYYAVLELPECVRHQVCLTCFHDLKTQTADDEMPFHWRVRRKTDGTKQPALNMASLRILFDKLGDAMEAEPVGDETEPGAGATGQDQDAGPMASGGPERAAGLRYLVALLLLRKRMLKMADARNPAEEQADLLVVDPKIEGMEPVALTAPSLEPEALSQLKDELMVAIGAEDPGGAGSGGEGTGGEGTGGGPGAGGPGEQDAAAGKA